jgi:hypothetical protein
MTRKERELKQRRIEDRRRGLLLLKIRASIEQ